MALRVMYGVLTLRMRRMELYRCVSAEEEVNDGLIYGLDVDL